MKICHARQQGDAWRKMTACHDPAEERLHKEAVEQGFTRLLEQDRLLCVRNEIFSQRVHRHDESVSRKTILRLITGAKSINSRP
ncbi:hypothetical protein BJF93_04175 [Xaviernesmea oryzae]|uniref:Uncharacterized protein n=1 Tax=Xaviernesmea oryzae TaxID=464029 RepID=A0A1Q9AUL3_9HYPH|nr:hypothetical protein BJF93_04175 [Xaviernesmea oryzae]